MQLALSRNKRRNAKFQNVCIMPEASRRYASHGIYYSEAVKRGDRGISPLSFFRCLCYNNIKTHSENAFLKVL